MTVRKCVCVRVRVRVGVWIDVCGTVRVNVKSVSKGVGWV